MSHGAPGAIQKLTSAIGPPSSLALALPSRSPSEFDARPPPVSAWRLCCPLHFLANLLRISALLDWVACLACATSPISPKPSNRTCTDRHARHPTPRKPELQQFWALQLFRKPSSFCCVSFAQAAMRKARRDLDLGDDAHDLGGRPRTRFGYKGCAECMGPFFDQVRTRGFKGAIIYASLKEVK